MVWRQVPTPSGVQDSMLVVGEMEVEEVDRLRPLAHPDLPYQESRRLRDDAHPVFRWMRGVPLDVIDSTLRGIVVEDPVVKRTAGVLSRSVKKLGEKGALELIARVGYLLAELEKGE